MALSPCAITDPAPTCKSLLRIYLRHMEKAGKTIDWPGFDAEDDHDWNLLNGQAIANRFMAPPVV